MNDLTYWVALSRVEEMTAIEKNRLLVELYNRRLPLAGFFEASSANREKLAASALITTPGREALEEACETMATSAFMTEELLSQGYKLLPVMSVGYPSRIKRRMKYSSPVLLYCRGNISLLESAIASVSGTEYPGDDGIRNSQQMATHIYNKGMTLLSGEVRGCDQSAFDMHMSLGGNAIVAVAGGLFKFGTGFGRLYRYITRGRLAIVSGEAPDSFSNSKREENRDKIILSLADEIYIAEVRKGENRTSLIKKCILDGGFGDFFEVSAPSTAGNKEKFFDGIREFLPENPL